MYAASKLQRAALILACALAAPVTVSAQNAESASSNPLADHSRWMYAGVKTLLLKSAEKVPEEHYGFKPTDAVRSFGQIIGHAADAQYMYCSMVRGERPPMPAVEKTKTSKADLIAALKEAFAYCDRAYDTLTDVTGAQVLSMGPYEMPKLGMLYVNVIHSTEHYGNLVTYMRLKNIVPPSSEPGFTVAPPKR